MKITAIEKGGPGSGNWGHGGLKGVHGGSTSSKSQFTGGSAPEGDYSEANIRKTTLNSLEEPLLQEMNIGVGWQPPLHNLYVHSDEVRSDLKERIVGDVQYSSTPKNALSEEDVADYLLDWAEDSNMGRLSRRLQHAAGEEFGVELSDWQKELMGNNITSTRTDKRFLRAMYDNTQNDLADMGYSPDDTITLYRGVVMKMDVGVGDSVNYQGNAIESWSLLPTIADDFAEGEFKGLTLSMDVPVRNILSTATTGMGCLPEYELTIFGNVPNQRARIVTNNDGGYIRHTTKAIIELYGLSE